MRMKRLLAAALAALTLLWAAGCGGYESHYSAVGFVHSNEAKSAFMEYYTFEGRMVFRLRADGTECLVCDAGMEAGSVSVTCVSGGEESVILTVSGGDGITVMGDPLPRGTVYILVDSPEKSMNGSFHFTLEKQT